MIHVYCVGCDWSMVSTRDNAEWYADQHMHNNHNHIVVEER